MPTTPVIVDCDPGIDDLVALLLALRSREISVRAVTTSYGNAALADTSRNATTLLALLGDESVPLYAGSARPLVRTARPSVAKHGAGGAGRAPVGPAAPVQPDPSALLEVLALQPTPVTLVTLGPLTNLASAIERDPDLVRAKIGRHIGSFGTDRDAGSASHVADFNSWCDPEAVVVVLQADLPTEMIVLDVARQLQLEPVEIARMAESSDPAIGWVGEALEHAAAFHRTHATGTGVPICDPVAVGAAIDGNLLRYRSRHMGLDLDENERRGHTVERPGGFRVTVATSIDLGKMRSMLARVFGWSVGSPSHPGDP